VCAREGIDADEEHIRDIRIWLMITKCLDDENNESVLEGDEVGDKAARTN
jgi:hypothetical protein